MRKLTDDERVIAKAKATARVNKWKAEHPERTREIGRDGYHRNKGTRPPRKRQVRDPAKVRKNSRDAYWRHRDARVQQAVAHYAAHREEGKLRARQWAAQHPEEKKARDAQYYRDHPEKWVGRPEWQKKFPEKHAAKQGKRRARKLQATPAWANEFFIAEAYDLAKRRTDSLGFKWEVDHTIPLKSRIVCGLHVENNLQVIPAMVNRSKSNRHWPDMPQAIQHS